jgi:hypothetical protein
MPLFELPTAAAITTTSKLRPEQLNTLFTESDVVTAVQGIITDKYDVVAEAISDVSGEILWPPSDEVMAARYPDWSEEKRTEKVDRQKSLARQAVEAYALASLYGRAGYLNRDYWERAAEYREEGAEYLKLLKSSIAEVTRQETDDSVPRSQAVTVRSMWG